MTLLDHLVRQVDDLNVIADRHDHVVTRAATHGHTIELICRPASKGQALADQIGSRATEGGPR